MSKKRSPKIPETKLHTLLDEVEKQKPLLFIKHTNVATNAAKKRTWENICTKINTCNKEYVRKTEEVRKKWTTYTSNTKKYTAQIHEEARRKAEDLQLMISSPSRQSRRNNRNHSYRGYWRRRGHMPDDGICELYITDKRFRLIKWEWHPYKRFRLLKWEWYVMLHVPDKRSRLLKWEWCVMGFFCLERLFLKVVYDI